MTFKVSDNQYSRPYPSDSWASCLISLISGHHAHTENADNSPSVIRNVHTT